MSLWIAGLGTAVPPHKVLQEEAADFAQQLCASARGAEADLRLLNRIYRHSGIRTRHSVVLKRSSDHGGAEQSFYPQTVVELDGGPTTAERMRIYEREAAPIASDAAAAALGDAKAVGQEVTHLVTVSCSGFYAPGWDTALIRESDISPQVSRTHVGFMGCHGALNALRVAKAFTDSDPRACVLLCAIELCSLHYHYSAAPDKLLANALFADGAAALLARGGAQDNEAWSLDACGSVLVPGTEDLMRWSIRDHGFEMGLSPRVPEVIHRSLRPWLEQWLHERGLSIPEVCSWAIHPGGPRILAACAEAMGLPLARLNVSQEVLSRFGNMSSATVLFVLDALRRAGAPRPCVALAFGPGLVIEAALFR
jgi:predicted naringenin-chalcone synthase